MRLRRTRRRLRRAADLLGIPVVRPRVTETTALGAAWLAGLACGIWESPAALEHQWQVDTCFEPQMDPDRRAALMARWARAVAHARAWAEPAE